MTDPSTRPTFAELADRILALSDRSGCCLHIVVEDENVSDADVAWCIRYAEEQGHPECVALATLLSYASERTRRRLSHLQLGR